jgi:hypothetical protein
MDRFPAAADLIEMGVFDSGIGLARETIKQFPHEQSAPRLRETEGFCDNFFSGGGHERRML